MQWDNVDVAVNEKLSLLGKSRRRFTLYYLLSNRHADIDSLSVQVAAWERDTSVAAVDDEARRAVANDLHHNHLPRLADHGIVEFDPRSGAVVRDDGFEDIRPLVEGVRTDEEEESEEDARGPVLSP